MPDQDLTIHVRAKDDGASAVLEKQKSLFESLGAKARELNMEARQSGENQIEKLLKGGGALGLATFAGEMITKTAEKVSELNKQFAEGKIDTEGYWVGVAEGAPIIGKFVEAGQAIRNAFTGEKDAIDETNESMRLSNEFMEGRVRLAEAYGRLLRTQRDYAGGEQEKIDLGGLHGTDRERKVIDTSRDDDIKKRDEQYADSTTKITAERVAALKPLQAEIDLLNEKRKVLVDRKGGWTERVDDAGDIADLTSQIRSKEDQKRNVLEADRQKQAEADGAHLEGNAKRTARAAADAAALEKKIGDDRAHTAAESQRKIDDITAQGEEKRLRDAGKDREADIAAIARKRLDAVAVEKEDLPKRIAADPSNEAALRQQSADKIAAIDATAAQEEISANLAADKAQQKILDDRARTAEEGERKITDLKSESKEKLLRDSGKANEAEVEAIHRRRDDLIVAEKEALKRRIDADKENKAALEAQSAKLIDAISGTADQEEAAVKKKRDKVQNIPQPKMEGGESGNFLIQGVGLEWREQEMLREHAEPGGEGKQIDRVGNLGDPQTKPLHSTANHPDQKHAAASANHLADVKGELAKMRTDLPKAIARAFHDMIGGVGMGERKAGMSEPANSQEWFADFAKVLQADCENTGRMVEFLTKHAAAIRGRAFTDAQISAAMAAPVPISAELLRVETTTARFVETLAGLRRAILARYVAIEDPRPVDQAESTPAAPAASSTLQRLFDEHHHQAEIYEQAAVDMAELATAIRADAFLAGEELAQAMRQDPNISAVLVRVDAALERYQAAVRELRRSIVARHCAADG